MAERRHAAARRRARRKACTWRRWRSASRCRCASWRRWRRTATTCCPTPSSCARWPPACAARSRSIRSRCWTACRRRAAAPGWPTASGSTRLPRAERARPHGWTSCPARGAGRGGAAAGRAGAGVAARPERQPLAQASQEAAASAGTTASADERAGRPAAAASPAAPARRRRTAVAPPRHGRIAPAGPCVRRHLRRRQRRAAAGAGLRPRRRGRWPFEGQGAIVGQVTDARAPSSSASCWRPAKRPALRRAAAVGDHRQRGDATEVQVRGKPFDLGRCPRTTWRASR